MRAEIICVGTELLLGDILNTNAQYLSRELSSLGIIVYNQQVVGDNATRLAQAVEIAKQRCDIVFFSGGLGPTEDDITKHVVAQIYNDELVHSVTVERYIKEHFEKLDRPMTENNLRQALIPRKGRFIKNDHGTAPGMIFVDGEKLAVLLPGPPRELMAMMEQDVNPLLKKLVKGSIKSSYVKTIGIGESKLETMLQPLLERANPTAALYAGQGEVTVRLTARADSEQEAQRIILLQTKEIEEIISEYIYGIDVKNIETIMVQYLIKAIKTVAVAESCTGGIIASRITSVPNASQVFELGLCTYSDKQKVEMLYVNQDTIDDNTAVSPEVAIEMAQNVRTMAEADFGIATTGFSGPSGDKVGLVYIAVATKEKTYVSKHHFVGDRENVTYLASQYAFDILRRILFNLPQPYAVEQKREKPKKKFRLVKNIITLLMLAIVAASLAFGFLWLKKDDKWKDLPIISDILNTKTVSTQAEQGEPTGFFKIGFEPENTELSSSQLAQNHNVNDWIDFESSKIDQKIKKDSISSSAEYPVDKTEDSVISAKNATRNILDTPSRREMGDISPQPAPTNTPPSTSPQPTAAPLNNAAAPPASAAMQNLTVTLNGKVTTAPASEILSKIVGLEMTSSWNPEALKAQAVATHTYIRYQQKNGVTAPTVSGRDTVNSNILKAVNQVLDKVITVDGEIVYTPYFAMSAGNTNDAYEVWGTKYDHLKSVESKYDNTAPGYLGQVSISKEQMENIIRNTVGTVPIGEPSDWFKVLSYTKGGYVKDVLVSGASTYYNTLLNKNTQITGRWLREDILKMNSALVVRSAAFDISYSQGKFTITTRGHGHGAGMSQWGAQLYAENDSWDYQQILKHYYTGISIDTI